MQKLTQVSNYDIWYLDNFYDNPDQLRDYALNLPYIPGFSTYPGIRTPNLSMSEDYQKEFSLYFIEKLENEIPFFNKDNCLDITFGFHKIPLLYHDMNSILNTGYIHVDLIEEVLETTKRTFAGLIYLNKKTCKSSGTSFFRLKQSLPEDIKITDNDNYKLFSSLFENDGNFSFDDLFYNYLNFYNPIVKRKYYGDFVDNKKLVESKFEKILEVENVYNRLVIYDASYFHTASHFYVNDFEDRLTQPFFIVMK